MICKNCGTEIKIHPLKIKQGEIKELGGIIHNEKYIYFQLQNTKNGN